MFKSFLHFHRSFYGFIYKVETDQSKANLKHDTPIYSWKTPKSVLTPPVIMLKQNFREVRRHALEH